MSFKSSFFTLSPTAGAALVLSNPPASGLSMVVRSLLVKSPFIYSLPVKAFIRRSAIDYVFAIGTHPNGVLQNLIDRSIVLEPGDELYVKSHMGGPYDLLTPNIPDLSSVPSSFGMVNWLETTDLRWKSYLEFQPDDSQVILSVSSNPSILESLYIWRPMTAGLPTAFTIRHGGQNIRGGGAFFDAAYPICPFDVAIPINSSLIFNDPAANLGPFHLVASYYEVDNTTTSQYYVGTATYAPAGSGSTAGGGTFTVPTGYSASLIFLSYSRDTIASPVPPLPASLSISLGAAAGLTLYDSSWDHAGSPYRFVNLVQAPLHLAAEDGVSLKYTNDGGPPMTIFYAYTLAADA